LRTDAASVKHQILGLAVVEAPQHCSAATKEDSKKDIKVPGRSFCEDGVVGGCSPEVLICDRRLPEGKRVGDPVGEEGA